MKAVGASETVVLTHQSPQLDVPEAQLSYTLPFNKWLVTPD